VVNCIIWWPAQLRVYDDLKSGGEGGVYMTGMQLISPKKKDPLICRYITLCCSESNWCDSPFGCWELGMLQNLQPLLVSPTSSPTFMAKCTHT
jgi:hypothetical protein